MALPVLAQAQETRLESVVVTAPTTEAPLTVTTDPKAPRQPLPAHDGADLLKSIPGFSVIRKGGTDGDPVFRGMSGSRLGILLDGQEIHGGCGGRMDPPTAYIYPESYDRVTVLKGPQSVLHVPGSSAGVVLFERDNKRMTEPGWSANGSLTLGSFGRNDQYLEARGGNPDFYARANATRSDSDNYEDGDGKEVHSFYTRWSTSAALGWTPDDNTLIELSAGRSDGEAAYADRTMDGTKFERENASIKFEKRNISPLVSKVEANVYYSYVDHVMDNYSLRVNTGMKMLNNPDRETKGGRVAVTLTPSDPLHLVLGADMKTDDHTFRDGTNYYLKPRDGDLSFDRYSAFGEATYSLTDSQRIIGGVRIDDHEVADEREVSPSFGRKISETATSGFARFEQDYAGGAGTWYAGVGYVERFPDYWEYMRANTPGGETFDSLDPERTTQLDIGATWGLNDWTASVSGFYSKVDDYILLKWDPAAKKATASVNNIDATVYGFEAELGWRFATNWRATGALAWVRGSNDTDSTALAQQPPLEGRLGLEYNDGVYSAGALLRAAAKQDRYDYGSGSIVANGFDRNEPTPGFAVFSVNAGWRPSKATLLTVGVDNLFDRTYREHLSRSGASVFGYDPVLIGEAINEPGRTFWVKAQLALD
jgi:iron complex outermembrane receptor protein